LKGGIYIQFCSLEHEPPRAFDAGALTSGVSRLRVLATEKSEVVETDNYNQAKEYGNPTAENNI
jgi:hypothetical protein